jgi:hypothetical protein
MRTPGRVSTTTLANTLRENILAMNFRVNYVHYLIGNSGSNLVLVNHLKGRTIIIFHEPNTDKETSGEDKDSSCPSSISIASAISKSLKKETNKKKNRERGGGCVEGKATNTTNFTPVTRRPHAKISSPTLKISA